MRQSFLFSLFACSLTVLAQAANKKTNCGLTSSPYRATARHIEGKGIGYSKGYTSVDLFTAMPPTASAVPFLDTRLHIFDNGRIATNVGVGFRYIGSSFVYGINSYYDYRETERLKYNQYSFGLEMLGKIWDFRVNGYFPVGNKRTAFYNTRFGYFLGNQMILSRTQEFAMKGFNAEAAIHFTERDWVRCYAALGPYYFQNAAKNAVGGKARISGTFLDRVKVELSSSYDSVFHWIGQGELSLIFPFGPKKKISQPRKCSQVMRLKERALQSVDRQEIIVTTKRKVYPTAINPTTGLPWNFLFVDNTSHSLGTFESPYANLTAAELASSPGDVIYVFPGDGSTTGLDQGIQLQPNQKLFGSGVLNPVVTQYGVVGIPALSQTLPTLTNAPGPSSYIVLVNDNCEVAGLNLVGATTFGIGCGDIVAFSYSTDSGVFRDNVITLANGGSSYGIGWLLRGNALIANNQITTDADPISLITILEDSLNVTISGNDLYCMGGGQAFAINLSNHSNTPLGNGELNAMITYNTIRATAYSWGGVWIYGANGGSTGAIMNTTLAYNSFSGGGNSGGAAVFVQGVTNYQINTVIMENTMSMNTYGIRIEFNENATMNSQILGNTIATNGANSIQIGPLPSANGATITSTISGNTLLAQNANGISITNQNSSLTSTIVANHISVPNAGQACVSIASNSGNAHFLTLVNNQMSSSGSYTQAVYIYNNETDVQNTLAYNTVTAYGYQGYGLYLDAEGTNVIYDVSNNSIQSPLPGSYGLYFDTGAGTTTALIENNQITSNASSGFGIDVESSADLCLVLSDNTANAPILLNQNGGTFILDTSSGGNTPTPTSTATPPTPGSCAP